MNTTVYAAMLLAFFNASQGRPPVNEADLTRIAEGRHGSVRLVLSEADIQTRELKRATGLRAEWRDGRQLWLKRSEERGAEVGIGLARAF